MNTGFFHTGVYWVASHWCTLASSTLLYIGGLHTHVCWLPVYMITCVYTGGLSTYVLLSVLMYTGPVTGGLSYWCMLASSTLIYTGGFHSLLMYVGSLSKLMYIGVFIMMCVACPSCTDVHWGPAHWYMGHLPWRMLMQSYWWNKAGSPPVLVPFCWLWWWCMLGPPYWHISSPLSLPINVCWTTSDPCEILKKR